MDSNDLGEFKELALTTFSAVLAKHGFERESQEIKEYSCHIIFGNGKRYIKISANIHPMDYPPYYNVILGEGRRDFPDSDWNAIALWRLMRHIQQTDTAGMYPLGPSVDLAETLERARDELLEFGISFLKGDLAIFKQVRALQNQNRKPYRISSSDKQGNRTVTDDPQSAKLKKKYS